MSLRKQWRGALFTAALTLCAAASAADQYQYTIVARTGDVVDGRTLLGSFGVALNDTGTMVFRAAFCAAGQSCSCNINFCRYGLFTVNLRGARPGAPQFVVGTGDIIDGKPLNALGDPVINNAGTIAFYSDYIVNNGLYSGVFTPSKALATSGSVISGKTIHLISPFPPSLNDWGYTVFAAQYESGGSILTGIFDPNRLLVAPGASVDGSVLTFAVRPIITNTFRLLFMGEYLYQGVVRRSVFTPYEQVVSNESMTPPYRINEFTANDLGHVWFIPETVLPSIYEVQEVGFRNRVQLVAGGGRAVAGYPMYSPFLPAVNVFGKEIFAMTIGTPEHSNGTGIFTPSEKILAPGDIILGKTLAGVAGEVALNNLGRFAFFAAFTDGTGALILAEPKR